MRPISWKRRLMVRRKTAYQSHSLLNHLPIEKLKMEYEANTILLKHEITSKTEALDKLTKEHQKQAETCKELQHQLQEISASVSQHLYTPLDSLSICLSHAIQHAQLQDDYKELQEQHSTLDAAYSDELLKTAKLHGQLSELQLLRTQHTM